MKYSSIILLFKIKLNKKNNNLVSLINMLCIFLDSLRFFLTWKHLTHFYSTITTIQNLKV
jgi:hypothetical protein